MARDAQFVCSARRRRWWDVFNANARSHRPAAGPIQVSTTRAAVCIDCGVVILNPVGSVWGAAVALPEDGGR